MQREKEALPSGSRAIQEVGHSGSLATPGSRCLGIWPEVKADGKVMDRPQTGEVKPLKMPIGLLFVPGIDWQEVIILEVWPFVWNTQI